MKSKSSRQMIRQLEDKFFFLSLLFIFSTKHDIINEKYKTNQDCIVSNKQWWF
jgi:hypothetical protein